MGLDLKRTSRRLLSLLAAPLLLHACNSEEGGYGRPGVDTGPVDPITLRFENTTEVDVYLWWARSRAEISVSRNGSPVIIDRDCVPMCIDGCHCGECSESFGRVRRVPAGTEVTLVWEPLHFVASSCDGSSDCLCAEMWPLTAGSYDVVLEGFTEAEGGTQSVDDPNVIVGAVPGPLSKQCAARADFTLKGGVEVRAPFACDL
jgi:hypothetical protein